MSLPGDLTVDDVRRVLGPERAARYTETQLEAMCSTANQLTETVCAVYRQHRAEAPAPSAPGGPS